MENQKYPVINEDEKNTNPVYKVIFNKIRNLNKKLSQIAHIETLEPKTLKISQKNKLDKKDDIIKEIQKHEEFAGYYKQIVIENDLVYDKIDDLIKISALLTIGKKIGAEGFCPQQTKHVYSHIYEQIFNKSCYNGSNHLSDEIVRVYHILTNFIDKPQYYSQCKDYMTYIQQIQERKSKHHHHKHQGKIEHLNVQIDQTEKHRHDKHHQKDNKVDRINQFAVHSEIIKITLEHKKGIDAITNIQQMNMESILTASQTINRLSQCEIKLEKHQTSQTLASNSEKEKEKIQPTHQIKQTTHHSSNAWNIKKHEQFSTKDTQHHSYSHLTNNQSNVQNYRENNKKRNRKNKRKDYVQAEFNVRKCSDTSLEPTPDKYRGKKMRYMEKIE